MFKLDLEKAEEPEIKLPTYAGSSKKKESSRKTYISVLLTMPKLRQCGPQQTLQNSSRGGNTRPPDLPLEKSVCKSGNNIRTGHGTTDYFQIRKGVHQSCILSPCLFNLYEEYIMRNAGLDEAQARIKIAGRNIKNIRYADDTNLMAESEEELKSLLMKEKEESEKCGLKFNIQKTKLWYLVPSLHGK